MISAVVLYVAIFAAVAAPYAADFVNARKVRVAHGLMLATARTHGANAAQRAKVLASIASNPTVPPAVLSHIAETHSKANADVRKRAQFAVSRTSA